MAEGPVNLNWGQIMKTINDNPLEFFRDGGWTFLGGTGAEGSDKVCGDPLPIRISVEILRCILTIIA